MKMNEEKTKVVRISWQTSTLQIIIDQKQPENVEYFNYMGRITSIYEPTNAHIISHKTLSKHFKTLQHVSILSDHHQGALFLAKGMLQYSQFNSYLQTRCCGSIYVDSLRMVRGKAL